MLHVGELCRCTGFRDFGNIKIAVKEGSFVSPPSNPLFNSQIFHALGPSAAHTQTTKVTVMPRLALVHTTYIQEPSGAATAFPIAPCTRR